jgi:membrane protein YdbS with pleckstrin-like domain
VRVEETDPDGVDYGWVMQVTFVLTILVGAPVVGALSLGASLPTWGARAGFAVRVGAVVWIVVAVPVYLYARRAADEAPEEP